MNIRESLLAEHSKQMTLRIAVWIGSDINRFAELIQLIFYDEPLIGQRAAWVLPQVLEEHPQLIYAHLETLVEELQHTRHHDAVRRNTLKVLQEIEIPESFWGAVADACFRYLADPREPTAIRIFSMSVLWNICRRVPELQSELELIIEDQWEHAAGFRSRGRKILKRIKGGKS